MARGKTQNPTFVEDVEEMTVVVLKFKGRGETLRKGFDTVSEAFAAVGAVPAVKQMPPPQNVQSEIQTNGNHQRSEAVDEEELEEISEAAGANGSTQRKRYTPKFLDSFNLDGDGTKWSDFAARKNPKNDNERYLIAGEWLTKHGGEPHFTVEHVFTCFRDMKWREQVDFSQPLRYMKKRKSYFAVPEHGKWKLTPTGMKEAEAVGKATEQSGE